MNAEKLSALLRAADEHKDCHHVMSDGKFCVYLEPAHHSKLIDHPFISLASLLREVAGGVTHEPSTAVQLDSEHWKREIAKAVKEELNPFTREVDKNWPMKKEDQP